jgi:ABC-2 type transport system permease protein
VPGVRLYWEVARRGYRRYATYRGATVAGLFTNTVFGFLRSYLLMALLAGQATGMIGGFGTGDSLSFVWLGQGLIMVVYLFSWQEIGLRVRSGDIATDLSRPYDFQGYWLAQDLGRALYHLVSRGIVPFLVGMAVFTLTLPHDPVIWLAFAVSVALGVVVSFALRFMANLSAFWLLDYAGPLVMLTAAFTLLSGFILPINFFPPWLRTTARALPFAAVIQTPVEVFVGKHHGASLAAVLGIQVAWAVLLLAVGRFVLKRAMHKLVVQGG